MPHFFINTSSILGNKITITDKENYNHIAKSLRARVGEVISFCSETETIYRCRITEITKTLIVTEILSEEKSKRKLPFYLTIAQSPLRSDAQLTLIEKVTELGVYEIYPVHTDHCALPKSAAQNKIDKWQKTIYEAAKQCERANIPTIHHLCTLDSLPFEKYDKVIIFAERNADMSLKEFVKKNPIQDYAKVLVIIGPEGGFSDVEFNWFKTERHALVSLGKLVLKAETAAITGVGNLIYGYSE